MYSFPLVPEVAPDARASVPLTLRYDDLTQDGQVKLTALPTAIGRACFEPLWAHHPLVHSYRDGVLPILSRLVIEADPHPTMLAAELRADGTLQLAAERDEAGRVTALFLNMWAEVHAPLGRSFGKQLPDAGRLVRIGRVFSEHIFTRPFAAPSERKVLAFDLPGLPTMFEASHRRTTVAEVLTLPEGARPFDAEPCPDTAPWAFGLAHTDHNQHVNSLVYPRLFEDAVLRRLAEREESTRVLGRFVELTYRKPCFAGDRLACKLQSFALGDELGAVGHLGASDASGTRAHCAMRMLMRRVER